jgi:ribose transport system permease protein
VAQAIVRAQREYPLMQVAALVVIFLYGSVSLDGFDSRLSISSTLVLAGLLGFAAAGQTLCVLVGGIDLSVAAWIVAGATITVQLMGASHWPAVEVLALIAALSLAAGGAVGYICHRFRVQPLIVTLAANSIVSGAVIVWSKAYVVGSPPFWLTQIASPAGKTFGIAFPPIVLIWAVLIVVMAVVLHRTVIGRWIYATGSNPRGAELALVPTRRVWVGCFAVSALIAAMSGVLLAAFAGGGDATIGDPYLYTALTAVIVGGTAFGARGDYTRTVLGALLLTELTTVMIGHGFNYADQQIVSGVLILLMVAFYARDRRIRDRI